MINEACEQAGLPRPFIEERFNGVAIELMKAEQSEELGNKLGNTKEQILETMRINPKVSGSQLAEQLKVTTTTIEKNIKQLRESGLIKRVKGTRGFWQIIENSED